MFGRKKRVAKERATLRVSTKSWHGKVYAFWKASGGDGKKEGYRENLCHYMRVVLFWGPLRWFFTAHPKRAPWFRPWVVTLATLLIGSLTSVIFIWPQEFLQGLGILGIIMGGIIAIIGVMALTDYFSTEIQSGMTRFGNALGRFFSRSFFVLIGNTVVWFFTARWARVIMPWNIVLAASYVACWIIFPEIALYGTLGLIGFAMAVGILTVLGYCGYLIWNNWLFDWLFDLLHRDRPVQEDTGPGMLKVTKEYVVARKHRVCPFIDVAE